ncbi:glutathione transferase GstA [Hyphococcus flavus]|uniref:Glutathione transferase GstA n=1 Tax=Hyphococcus flavus TaxID=1866326 RepID=A0AAF0CHS2_9PROT|nr:glutathione transferase GstA [Hyphococcus flavus]WDI32217.1 glutathione transferase GstA [Hyphococcus flavus]
MKLYYKPGACSLASHIALNEAGADFSIEKVDTKAKRTETGEDFLKISPNGYVPALEVNTGEILTEGPAILQYIADTNKAANLAPENGTVARARVNGYLNFVGSELHKAFGPFFGDTPLEGAAREQAEANVARRFNYLEEELSDGRKFLTGDQFTIADAYLFVVANWTSFAKIDLGQWPNIASFVARVAERPAVQKALAAEGLLKKAA